MIYHTVVKSSSIRDEKHLYSDINVIVIYRDQIDLKQVNIYVREIFSTYHVNKIRNHDLYKTIFHDLFELKQKY